MYYIKRLWCVGLLLTIILTMFSGCNPGKELVSQNGFYFDTTIGIQIYTDKSTGETLLRKCFSLCEEIEKIFSRTRRDSELYKLNHRQSDQVQVSEELAYVIEEGLKYCALTEGAFDITIAPVSDLWDFKSENPQIPDASAIATALEMVDYTAVHVEGQTISFDRTDTMIDLGALVKGYAADRIKELLVENGIESALISLGGNIMAVGSRPDGSHWRVGIQKPFSDRGEVLDTVVEVADKSVVSSGVYERYFERDGVTYHHILDPKTGYPVETDLWQMTVVSDNSMTGDVLSTCCMLLGQEQGQNLTSQLGFSNTWLHLEDQCAMIEQ